jgi:hypothetical protein
VTKAPYDHGRVPLLQFLLSALSKNCYKGTQ